MYDTAFQGRGLKVDVLINNAGIVCGKKLLDISMAEVERTMKVNCLSNFAVIKASETNTPYKSKWRNIWIRDVFCYPYAQDKCPIMNQRSL